MTKLATLALLVSLVACGPSPNAPEAPTGTLVVVIVQGPERVPFKPKLARIQQASEQLAAKLGHSIRIELDGALLPQGQDGADDLVARLVEAAVRDVDRLAQRDARALAFAKAGFERLVVRYSPADAASRGRRSAAYDAATKTVDVVHAQASWTALEGGAIAGALLEALEAGDTARYDGVMPDKVPRAERRDWFVFHEHGRGKDTSRVGSVSTFRVRGMVMLHGLARRDGDAELEKDAKKWLLHAAGDFQHVYGEGKGEGVPFREAEQAYMGWLNAELPRLDVADRGALTNVLWPIDFRSPMSARDRFAKDAFPGIDRMKIATDAIDGWIAAGHPNEHGKVPDLFVHVVCPVYVYTDARSGHRSLQESGRCDDMFARWAMADDARAATYTSFVLGKHDPELARPFFHVAHRVLREPGAYLALLRRAEGDLPVWREGAELLRPMVFRPDPALLEDARRLWRTATPALRGWALFWFARHAEGSYTPEETWVDLRDGQTADAATLTSFLEAGEEAFQLLPAAWPALTKGARMGPVTQAAHALGERGVRTAGVLGAIARMLCEEPSLGELAELRAFAQAELAARPGAGLSDVVAATDPTACKPKTKPYIAPKPTRKKPGAPPDPVLFPPKAPLPAGER